MLISSAVTAKLICANVFAYACCWFSYVAAHLLWSGNQRFMIQSFFPQKFTIHNDVLMMIIRTILCRNLLSLCFKVENKITPCLVKPSRFIPLETSISLDMFWASSRKNNYIYVCNTQIFYYPIIGEFLNSQEVTSAFLKDCASFY